jgi:predicted DNA-binding transcriptional regulator AlpA
MIKKLQEFREMLLNILEEMKQLREAVKLSIVLNKEVLTLNEASLITGYKESYLYKLNSQGVELPVYSTCGSGKLYFKRTELFEWMTKHKRNNFVNFQNQVDNYLTRKIS